MLLSCKSALKKRKGNQMKTSFTEVLSIIIVLSLLIFVLCSCAGQHCIKIGGNYEGVEGNLEYCFDFKSSEKIDMPVLEGIGGQKLLAVKIEELEKLLEIEVLPVAPMKINTRKNLLEKIKLLKEE